MAVWLKISQHVSSFLFFYDLLFLDRVCINQGFLLPRSPESCDSRCAPNWLLFVLLQQLVLGMSTKWSVFTLLILLLHNYFLAIEALLPEGRERLRFRKLTTLTGRWKPNTFPMFTMLRKLRELKIHNLHLIPPPLQGGGWGGGRSGRLCRGAPGMGCSFQLSCWGGLSSGSVALGAPCSCN